MKLQSRNFLHLNLTLSKEIRELLVRVELVSGRGPEIRGEEGVGVTESLKASLDEVTLGTGVTTGTGENVIDTGERHQLLGDRGSDNSGTTRGRDKTNRNGTSLTGNFHRNGMDRTEFVTPVTTANRDQLKLGGDDGTTDSGGNFLTDLGSETDVTSGITDKGVAHEAVTLTSGGHFLDWVNLDNFILQNTGDRVEVINDLVFTDREGVKVDLFKGSDLVVMNQSSELGARGPGLILLVTLLTTFLTFLTTLLSTFLAEAFSETSFTHFGCV